MIERSTSRGSADSRAPEEFAQSVDLVCQHSARALANDLEGSLIKLLMQVIPAPGVGTPVPGGLTYREAHLIMEIIADAKSLSSLDIVEINPILDIQNQTGSMAVELAASLFGKSIL